MTEVLTQEEIDQLLAAINDGEYHPVPRERKIKLYDFKRPDKFSKDQIRTISLMHETFAFLTTNSLSIWLRSMCHVKVASVDQLTYEEFIRSIPTPTTLAIINMNPLKGSALLEIDPEMTFFIIDRICGGTGNPIKNQHELTAIETNIMEGIIVNILGNMRKAWTEVIDLRLLLSRIDTNPQFPRIVPLTDMVVLITLEAKVSDVNGMINICIPFSTLEPIMGKFSTYQWMSKINFDSSGKVNAEALPVKLTAEILRRNYSIKEINEWEVGTELLPSSPLVPGRCDLRFGNRCVWQCEILPEIERYVKCIKVIGITGKLFGTEGNIMETSKVNPIADDALSNVRLTISVEIGQTVKTVKEVQLIGEGTILELDKLAGEPVDVKANGVIIARGEVVVIDENFGVRIIDVAASVGSSEQPEDKPSEAEAGEHER